MNNEELVTKFFLGDLSEQEQLQVEERYFRDDAYFEQLLALEDELIDKYVQSQLSATEREKFEQHFLVTPARRRRVEFARTFLTALAGESPPLEITPEVEPSPASWWQSIFARPRRDHVRQLALVAMSLVLFFSSIWLISSARRLQGEVASLQSNLNSAQQTATELRQQLEAQRAQTAQTNAELLREKGAGAQASQALKALQAELQRVKSTNEAGRGQAAVAFIPELLLRAGVVRGAEQQPLLIIPPGARMVRLKLVVEGEDYQSYQASLLRNAQEIAWKKGGWKSQGRGSAKTVNLLIPVGRLRAGDYILQLRGVADGHAANDTDDYQFRVKRD